MLNTLLIILDGWGIGAPSPGNAIERAQKPNYDRLLTICPNTSLKASGKWVGLPDGQIGSSEVGHTIMSAGRNVRQLSTTITEAIRSESFFKNTILTNAAHHALKNRTALHVIGLTSDGGVHSYWEHLKAVLTLAKKEGLQKYQLAVHAILDGRDVGRTTGKSYIDDLERLLHDLGIGRIATIHGRYWIMDRDKRWERVGKAYGALVRSQGLNAQYAAGAISALYQAGGTDEFMEPTVITNGAEPIAPIKNGDAVILYNFRADRMRQLAKTLSDPGFKDFDRGSMPQVHLACMTQYDVTLNLPVAFPPESAPGGKMINLASLISERAVKQLRIAETEKYAHVTYFFNGGLEKNYPHEDRILIPSPKVATYDQSPEMSAREITERLLAGLNNYPMAVCNFANADMVGHTGNFDAAVKACEYVDTCLGRILKAKESLGGALIVTADHGNSECVTDDAGNPHTAHTINPVPFILWTKNNLSGIRLRDDGDRGLRDIAPTILDLMELPQPSIMDGRSLVIK
ncbi:MAG: 2,3-bisphosphoglycerate-independent phosphoglycerate mutase [Elusimicrobia bacterium]|nr:2,3-bisphosphoglycerate-independent phosphoglycerate mutase [Elusimicrobiota bacterium]